MSIDDGYRRERRAAIGGISNRGDPQSGIRRDFSKTRDGLVPLLATNVPHQNDVEQRRIVDSDSGDTLATIPHLQARISDFQIDLRHFIPGIRFLQGGAHEERQRICK